jgi:glycosyltransferase involved in cell wall biosynthesis
MINDTSRKALDQSNAVVRKNILYTIDTTGPGGAEKVFVELIRNLDRNKYSANVVLKGKGWLHDAVVGSGITPKVINMDGSFNFSYFMQLVKIIREEKIDLIHSHLFGSNVYCSLAGFICRVPVISTFHGTVDSRPDDRLLKLKFHLINLGTNYIVFVSEYLKNYYLDSTPVNRSKSITIYNGVDSNHFSLPKNNQLREKLGFTNQDILIGALGNIRPAKGYDILLQAASIVTKKFPQCKFVVAGQGDEARYQDLLALREKLGLGLSFKFLGFISETEQFLNSIDLFVLPSITEGFSISTIEAMAAGKPCIVTDSGGPGEIISHLKDGILVEPNNPEAIAQGLKLCLNDEGMRAALVLNCKKTVRERFNIESMIRKYSELYDKSCR